MIDHLDNMLRHLFLTRLDAISIGDQVSFQPPDDDWRNEVRNNLQDEALNVYLLDLRENRKLRSNARVRVADPNGTASSVADVFYEQAPARLDCHYVISAWSPTQQGLLTEPTVDEHRLLYEAASILMKEAPLNASRIYEPGSAPLNPADPAAVHERIRNADLPTQVLPPEGLAKMAEFWGTMGTNHRLKPAIYLIVTLPVVHDPQLAGPMVTTRILEYRRTDETTISEARYQIGGRVIDVTGAAPQTVAGAWVRLEQPNGNPLQTAWTNPQGRFAFANVLAGPYQLNYRAQGLLAPAPRAIQIPSPTGEYDLELSMTV